MDRTLKSLSLLLSYPSSALQATMAEIGQVLSKDRRLTRNTRQSLQPLVRGLEHGDLYDLQERFVSLFDRSRSLSLNLFEHVHGESRDRGGAMVSLLETYREAGFEPTSSELPDHLPVLLEFLALRPEAEAKETLADAAHILEALRSRLKRRGSVYEAALQALVDIAQSRYSPEAVAAILEKPDDDPADLAALDAEWEETPVTFGADPNGDCPQVRNVLARMDTPAMPPQPDSRRPRSGGPDA